MFGSHPSPSLLGTQTVCGWGKTLLTYLWVCTLSNSVFQHKLPFSWNLLQETCWAIRIRVSRCTPAPCARWMNASSHVPFWVSNLCGSSPSPTLLLTWSFWDRGTGQTVYIREGSRSNSTYQHKLPLHWNRLKEPFREAGYVFQDISFHFELR